MPTVTRLREDRRGRVAVEFDGTPWRTLPMSVVVRAGLSEGRSLDRPALRLLRRELRRAEGLSVAGRALRARDLSRSELAARLERAAVTPSAAEESVAALAGPGWWTTAAWPADRAEAPGRPRLRRRGGSPRSGTPRPGPPSSSLRPWRRWSPSWRGPGGSSSGAASGPVPPATWRPADSPRTSWARQREPILDTALSGSRMQEHHPTFCLHRDILRIATGTVKPLSPTRTLDTERRLAAAI